MYASFEASREGLDPETIRANIQRVRERRDRAYAEYEAASRELDWLEEGLTLFGAETEPDGDSLLRGLVPDGAATQQPTLRQAIILIMRANLESDWTVANIVRALAMNGWTPRNGDATKRVSDMAGVMATEGHLNRTGRGVYKLSVLLAGALARALPPITDYRIAAAHGLPVPDHAAASEGPSDD